MQLISRLAVLRTPVGRFSLALVIMAGTAFYVFAPVFKGYALSDVAGRRNVLYPWAYQPSENPPAIYPDQAEQFYPWQVLLNGALKSGDFPLWDPYSFAGHPFFSNGQNTLLYPPRLFLALVTGPTKAHDLLVVSHMLLGGLTMFLLLSDARLCFGASLFGGMAWMLNSFMLEWMAWEPYLAVEALLPLAFLLMRNAVKRRSRPLGVWLGIVMALIFFGGQVLLVEFTLIAILCYGAYLFIRKWRQDLRSNSKVRLRRIAGNLLVLAIPAVVVTGLAAVQLIPTWMLTQAMDRSELTYAELIEWRLRVSDLVFFFVPHAIEAPYEPYLFLGTPTAILALIGLWRKHTLAAFSRVTGLIGLLLATGAPPLVWMLYKVVPGFSHMPLPRLLYLFNFAAAVLAAFGLDWVLRRAPKLARIKLEGARRVGWRVGITVALTGTVAVQMGAMAAVINRFEIDRGSLFPSTPLIEAFGDREKIRILPIYPEFHGSTSMVFNLQSGGGFDSIVPDRIGKLWRAIQDSAPNPVIDNTRGVGVQTQFANDTAFDLLPRAGVTDLVVPPAAPTAGGKWNIPDAKTLEASGLSGGDLVPLVGDWNGDGVETVGLCDLRSNTFYLWDSASRDAPPLTVQFGVTGEGWVPLTGDWNGDHIDTVGMYDPATSVFHLRNSNSNGPDDLAIKYGEPGKGWIPLAGDWNGGGVDDVGLYDPKQSAFSLRNPLKTDPNNETKFPFGTPNQGWIPIAGDWNGDKIDSVGLYNPKESVFFLKNLNEAGMPDVEVPYGLSNSGLKPVSGCWDNGVIKGRFDVASLFDPASAEFYLSAAAFIGHMKMDRVYAGPDGDIYKVKNPVPRVYIVPAAEVVDSPREALLRFSDLGFDPRKTVIVESDQLKKAGVEGPAASDREIARNTAPVRNSVLNSVTTMVEDTSSAQIISRTLNSMDVSVNSPGDGWLVVAESWDAGWTAKVDGGPVPVLPGNYAFRTIRIPAGRHIIQLVYRPVGFLLGSTMSGATLGSLFIVAVVWRFKRRRPFERRAAARQAPA